jgi:hypothetical protein
MPISTNQVSSVVLRPKKFETQKEIENCKRAGKKQTKNCAMQLSDLAQSVEG